MLFYYSAPCRCCFFYSRDSISRTFSENPHHLRQDYQLVRYKIYVLASHCRVSTFFFIQKDRITNSSSEKSPRRRYFQNRLFYRMNWYTFRNRIIFCLEVLIWCFRWSNSLNFLSDQRFKFIKPLTTSHAWNI